VLVETTLEEGVRTVTMNRPEKRNAMTDEMLELLQKAFSTDPDPSERVTVLRGAGRSFCAGRDISQGMIVPIEPVFHAVESYPLPVVAAVQGNAIAGGCEIALHCDFVVAMSDARFGMSLAQIGLAPTWFLVKKLLEVAGPVGARELLLLGDPVPATRMYDLGMISRISDAENFESTLETIVQRLVANAPLSLKAMKALLLREMAFRDGIEHADVDELVKDASNSNDAKEGMAARLAKRPANFTGS
jgi:enoyl-CoA hydratase/carnithine racemase|tara:strand:+ start:2255 stop:2992 length:738 start_codon:yes stop_codon:yes gene_type:complete